MTALRLSWSFARSAAAGMIVALMLAAAVPVIFGGKSFTVMSGSMEPAIGTGDLVMTMPVTPADAVGGDIVTFNDPQDQGRLLTHRVASSQERGGAYHFVTKGDANTDAERWSVAADGRIGRVAFRVPHIGHALALGRSAAARIVLITVPALVLAGFALMSIWRPRRKEGSDAPATI